MHSTPYILYHPAWHLLLQESKRTGMSTITVEHLVIALLHNGSTCRGILARSAEFPSLLLYFHEQPIYNFALPQAGVQSRRCQSQCTQEVARRSRGRGCQKESHGMRFTASLLTVQYSTSCECGCCMSCRQSAPRAAPSHCRSFAETFVMRQPRTASTL